MYNLLSGMRIVEGASFIAAPLCGLTFVQLGADVIRFDPIGGGPDFRRWPLAASGTSFYWEGLNKGKRSIAIDLSHPEGRELAVALITAAGEGGGNFVTNYPADGFLAHERLAARRPDLITVRVTGSSDGRTAVDYTVNCATGYPYLTGPEDAAGPVNHVLPAWDVTTGLTAAVSLLAVDRERGRTGKGCEIRVPLSDVAFATLGNLGHIAEVQTSGRDRERYGNALFGTFGRDFATADGRSIMIVAVTRRQWTALVDALQLQEEVSRLEQSLGADFAGDEGARFTHRAALFALVGGRVGTLTMAELAARSDSTAVCWGGYQTVLEALGTDPRLSAANPLFASVRHASGDSYLTPGFPGSLMSQARRSPPAAPSLGAHTDEVLGDVLKLSAAEIGKLHDAGLVAGC
ncbi:MAG: carnitine dehydratase [Rhizobiales bacterium]|nr:carnitine dehydratase [Hyphomicrobiales bacterium]